MGMQNVRIWVSRLLIGIVLGFNIECAMVFLLSPEKYAQGFELQGVTGNAVVQGMGILFLMWNVPYFVALLHPVKFRFSLIEACIMQCIGFTGETILLFLIPNGHASLQTSLVRFSVFDGTGLFLLLGSLFLLSENHFKWLIPRQRMNDRNK